MEEGLMVQLSWEHPSPAVQAGLGPVHQATVACSLCKENVARVCPRFPTLLFQYERSTF